MKNISQKDYIIAILGILLLISLTSTIILVSQNSTDRKTNTQAIDNKIEDSTGKNDLAITITKYPSEDADETITPKSTSNNQDEPEQTSVEYNDEYLEFNYNKKDGWKVDVRDTAGSNPQYIIYLNEKDNVYGKDFDGNNNGSYLVMSFDETEDECAISMESKYAPVIEYERYENVSGNQNQSGKELLIGINGKSNYANIVQSFCFSDTGDMIDYSDTNQEAKPTNFVGQMNIRSDINEEDGIKLFNSVKDSIKFKK